MGREIFRVPLGFAFPIGESFAEHVYTQHLIECREVSHDDCERPYYRELVPKGDCWQLWQTVSDGPISPVFKTADALIDWMCQPVPLKDRRPFAPEPYPSMPWAQGWRREVAEPFVKEAGWAPSMAIVDGRVMDGPEYVTTTLDRGKDG